MRLDIVTIFPDYLAPLELSLIGKARRERLLDVHVHDLRAFAHDRHHTVDDAPFGGGAGMVMKPEPWARALDHVLAQDPCGMPSGGVGAPVPRLIVPGPGGVPFTQALAHELAREPWLAFACGRYEGLDERIYEHARERMPVTVVSLGDYVLNGGEVAVLAIVEAVARLLPGVVGNAESLVEESHEDGLLEYPVYTRPALWNDQGTQRAVPDVLLSGNHAAIAAWRHTQRLVRTARHRPDLLSAATAADGLGHFDAALATPADAVDLWVLQRACWLDEAREAGSWGIPALQESVEDVSAGLAAWRTWVWRSRGRLVASGRARVSPLDASVWEIGRLMLTPDLRGRGLGRELLAVLEAAAPAETTQAWLNAGAANVRNQRMYRKAGYRRTVTVREFPGAIEFTKPLRPRKD